MKKAFNLFLILCLLTVTFYVPDFSVQAQTLGGLKSELAKKQAEYEENQHQKELSEREKSEIKARITSIQENIAQIGKEIVSLNEEITKLTEEIEKSEAEIKNILAFTQISNGESAYLEYAFGAQDFTDFIYRIAVSEQLTSYNDQLVQKYQNNIVENKKKQDELAQKKINLTNEQASLQVELEKIQNSIDEINSLDKSVKDQIDDLKNRIKIYTERGCKDDEDIDTCGRSILPSDTSFWRPMQYGQLTGWYGPNSCYTDNYGNRICRNHGGLDMSGGGANYNDVPAYAAANGIVVGITTIYDGNGNIVKKCGGNRVYIEHNINGTVYTTGYLHLRRLNVKLNQVVTKDTIIGIIGGNPNTEWWDTCTTGAHLHFEVSYGRLGKDYESRRVNPMTVVNFPNRLYVDFNDRITRY